MNPSLFVRIVVLPVALQYLICCRADGTAAVFRTITHDDTEAFVSDAPLVMLPGLLCDAALWQPQIDVLEDQRPIVVPDLSGQDDMAALADQVLREAPHRFALAGLSMGGYVALEIMRQQPDRVERLALLDTQAREDPPEQKARRRGLIELAGKGRFKGVTPRLLPMLIHTERLSEQPLVDIILGMAERIGKDGFINQQRAILSRTETLSVLPTITCPTLVMVGDADVLTPPEVAEEIAQGIPNANYVVIEHCGHLPALEQPDETTEALQSWLDL